MFQDQDYLLSEQFKARFGDVLAEIKVDSRNFTKGQLAWYPIYIFRRLIYLGICLIDSIPPSMRMVIIMLMNLSIIIYQTAFRPEKRHYLNNLAIYNEFMIQILTLHAMLFLGVITNSEEEYHASRSFAAFFTMFLLPNLLLAVLQLLKQVCNFLSGNRCAYEFKKSRRCCLRSKSSEIGL